MKFGRTLAIALICGFSALSYEILWYRALSFVTWGQATTFGLLLFCYLTGIALGSRRVRALCRDDAHDADARALPTLSLLITLSGVTGFLVIPALSVLAPFNPLLGLLLVLLSAAVTGAVFPLASHYGIAPDDRAGSRLSYVYLANIIGSAAGSFLTGFVLMDIASTRTISTALLLFSIALAAGILAGTKDVLARAPGRQALGSLLAATALGLGLAPWLFAGVYERLLFRTFGAEPLARVVENRHGVIVVAKDGRIFGGGAYDGAFNTSLLSHDANFVERALAIAALHPAPREVLMIGLSSGSWAQVIAQLPAVEHLTTVEINPGYLDLIPDYPEVASLVSNPKVTFVVDDGRRWILRHPERKFDAVVMNTTFHWRGYITNLLSREFMEMVRGRLRPGGVFYLNTTWSNDVQRTAALTFPHALRVVNFMALSDSPLAFDEARWKATLTSATSDGKLLLDPSDARYQAVLDHLLALGRTYSEQERYALETRESVLQRTERAVVVTDDNMRTEFLHPLEFPAAPP
jgi:spermidine synthase